MSRRRADGRLFIRLIFAPFEIRTIFPCSRPAPHRVFRAAAFLLISGFLTLAVEGSPFEGFVSATLTRPGSEPQRFVFTRRNNLLRIENASNKLEPINIIDLNAKKLTIIYPHNTTFVRVDLGRQETLPAGPPGADTGPAISPPSGFPSPPPIPSLPPRVGPGAGAGVAGATNVTGMPAMRVPGMIGASELKKTDETKKIEKFDCTLYRVSERGENLEIWATNDSSLFPFRLITRDYLGRRFGPQMLEEIWPEMLRGKSLFPLEATLKVEPGGMERLSFKIEKIEKKKIEEEKLFQPPERYIEIQAPGS